MSLFSTVPSAQGLYDPANEKDSCGVAMVATLNKKATHEIVSQALTALRNLEHRGASGAEPDSGDGAGILIRIPDQFYREVVTFELPESGKYAAGIAFIDGSFSDMDALARIAEEEGLSILGWRDVPTNSVSLGKTALSVMPKFVQLFISGKNNQEEKNMIFQSIFLHYLLAQLFTKECSQQANLKSSSRIFLMSAWFHHWQLFTLVSQQTHFLPGH